MRLSRGSVRPPTKSHCRRVRPTPTKSRPDTYDDRALNAMQSYTHWHVQIASYRHVACPSFTVPSRFLVVSIDIRHRVHCVHIKIA
jgi:hypothetical protein